MRPEGLTGARVRSKQTMREFDQLCLTPVRPLTPEEISDLREREGASQAVFARYLNVTTGLVSLWERGEKAPARRVPQAAGAGCQGRTERRRVGGRRQEEI